MILYPNYLKQFSCIGAKCEDSCCIGWKVSVDEDSYKKYKKSKNLVLKKKFDKYIIRERSQTSKKKFAKIKMDKQGRCSFLTSENWCEIHMELGGESLCYTCKIYPRSYQKFNENYEVTGMVSCPEIVRIGILTRDVMEFEISEVMSLPKFVNEIEHVNIPIFEIRSFVIEILQARFMTLDTRMIFLGMFLQTLQHSDPLEMIKKYRSILYATDVQGLIKDVPVNYEIQMRVMKELIDYRYSQTIENKRYLSCLKEVMVGLCITEKASEEEILENYNNVVSKYFIDWYSSNEYILENYLVNYVFKNIFPGKEVWGNYVRLVTLYSLLKLHLIGMLNYRKELGDEEVGVLIQSFSRVMEHNNLFLQQVDKLLDKNGYTNLAHLAIFIKN